MVPASCRCRPGRRSLGRTCWTSSRWNGCSPKLSTRRYAAGLEPVGIPVEQTASSTSKSAVSRRFSQLSQGFRGLGSAAEK